MQALTTGPIIVCGLTLRVRAKVRVNIKPQYVPMECIVVGWEYHPGIKGEGKPEKRLLKGQ